MSVKVRDLKDDGNYWIVVHDRRIPNRAHRIKKLVGKDKRAAESAASTIRSKLVAGDFSFMNDERETPTDLTLRNAVKLYLDERVLFGAIEQATREDYERVLKNHLYTMLGDRNVAFIEREDLKAAFEKILASGLSKSVCRNVLAPVKGTFEWLIDDKKMRLTNPAVRFGKLLRDRGDKKKRVKPLSTELREPLLDAAHRIRRRYKFLLIVAFRLGLRLSECFGLQWSDFDIAGRYVTVERQFRKGKLIDRTKKNKVRKVPLAKDVVDGFFEHQEFMEAEARRLGRKPSEWVFITRHGGPIRSNSSFIRKSLRPILHEASISRRVTMQNLRQTFCQDLVDDGHLVEASEWAGHSSVKVTGDYYSTGRSDHAHAIVDEVARRTGPRATPPRPRHPKTPRK